ncbi:hypothetical protein HDV01_003922 [Terramyces sp. JEL0728]|nr:hypothetical protein HDV01_003922 [Terramyces sp. JEL0728]
MDNEQQEADAPSIKIEKRILPQNLILPQMNLESDLTTPRLYSSRMESLPTSNRFGTMPYTPANAKLGTMPNTPLAFKYGTMPITPSAQSLNLHHASSVPTSIASVLQTPFLNRPMPNSPSFLKNDPIVRNSIQPVSFTPSERNASILEKEDSFTKSMDTMDRRYTAANVEIPFRTISRNGNIAIAVSDTLQRPSVASETIKRMEQAIPEEETLPSLHIDIEPEEPLFVAIEDYVPNLPDEIPIKIGDKIQIGPLASTKHWISKVSFLASVSSQSLLNEK